MTLNATARREVLSRNTTQTGAAEAKEDCYAKWEQEDIGKAKRNGGIVTTYPVDLGKYCWQVGNIFVFFTHISRRIRRGLVGQSADCTPMSAG